VLQPLAQIAPDFRDPTSGQTLAQLWAAHPQHAEPLPSALWGESLNECPVGTRSPPD
jgi:2-amino-4-hydroxy-6-hydroxymethyldihydropteridine diphosphokinase